MAAGGFYAVAHGRQVGVFSSWAEAEARVKGFKGAVFKKFPSHAEALAFVAANGASHAQSSSTPSSSSITSSYSSSSRKHARSEESGAAIAAEQPAVKRTQQQQAFYAVAEGHSTGVVTSWPQVLALTEGYARPVFRRFETRDAAEAFVAGYVSRDSRGGLPVASSASRDVEGLFSASFKKFPSEEEAKAFVQQVKQITRANPGDPDPEHPDTLVAFCDGSALQNGRRGCQAGYACVFPHCSAWNVAKKLVERRATNNRAEYFAALEAMKRANLEDVAQHRVLFIFSDSMLLIRSMTEWIGKWRRNNWCKADGTPVLNRDILEQLVAEQGKRRVVWRHVKAHTGKKDWRSKWNDVADRAARKAAGG